MSGKKGAKTQKPVKKGGFFKEVRAELGKITWPSKDEMKKAFGAVLIFTIIYIILIGGFDFIFKNLFAMILKVQ